MTKQPRTRRYTATPSQMEVNVRAIPLLPQSGWKIYSLDEFPIVGTVPKNYLAYGDPRLPGTCGYIAKKGRMKDDARECVTEEIISKIGAILPLEMAHSKLVRLSKSDVRFLSRNFVKRGREELLHGTELVARYFGSNPDEVETVFNLEDKKEEKELYTVNNMLTVLKDLFPDDVGCLREGFFKMIAFDAFIGAPDRHAMNWGVLAPLDPASAPVRFSPIFDTARGLFRECTDADLMQKEQRQGRDGFLAHYAERSRPILSTGKSSKENHFTLVKWIAANSEDRDHEAMRTVFNAVDLSSIEHTLQRKFRRIITQYRMMLIKDLLSFRIERLLRETQK